MLRNVVAVVLGIVLGSIANMALVSLNLAFFPMPAGVDPNDPEALAAHVATLPAVAFLLPFLAHFSQVLVGGIAASKIGQASPRILVGIVGALTVLGSVITNLQIDPPAWTWIELPLYLPVIWGTIRLAVRRHGAPPEPATQVEPS